MEMKTVEFNLKELNLLWHTGIDDRICDFLNYKAFSVISHSPNMAGLVTIKKNFEFNRGCIRVFDCFLKAKIFSASISPELGYVILSNEFPQIEGEEEWFLWYPSKKGDRKNDVIRGKKGIFKEIGLQSKTFGPRTAPEEKKKFVAKRRERKKED